MIRIVILGSGGAVPAPDRNLTSIAMRYEGDVYLFDCAEGTQRQMMKYGISYAKVKAIFLSHLHGDHIFGVPGLVNTLKMIERKEKLIIFGPSGTKKRVEELMGGQIDLIEAIEIDNDWKYEFEGEGRQCSFSAFKIDHGLKNAFGYVFKEEEAARFDKEKCAELGIKGRMFKTLQEKGEVDVKGKKITLAEVTYPKAGKKIVYSGDTVYCNETIEQAVGADVLFHESTFIEKDRIEADETRHSTALDAAKIAKKAEVKKLVLFHISNRYKDRKDLEDEAKKEFENSSAAFDGMEILV